MNNTKNIPPDKNKLKKNPLIIFPPAYFIKNMKYTKKSLNPYKNNFISGFINKS